MNRIAAIFIALMFAWPLEAQGGSESEVPPASGPNKEQLPEVKPDSGNIVRNDRVLSRLGFDLRIGGTLEFEFKRTQREEDQGVFSAPSRAHYGLDLDKASLTLSAMLRSNVHANVEFEFDEDDAQLDEGYVTFINPLTGIELIPRLSDDVHDNLLIGLEDPFWRNTKRVSESYSLLQNSLARDERMQAIYTVTLFDFAYVIAGISNGASLALDGSVDETENYPILQDDRGAHFAGFDDDDQISRRIETVLGAGVAFDLASGYSASVFPKNAAFRPMDLQRLHKDFAHFGVWFTSDRLSDNERTLLAGLQGADATSQKWRLGGIAEMVLDLDGAVLGARFEYALHP
ncbi:MAG: hypothetical protein L6Q71_03725 [Planctomycetes bacterium]|nr:hypothetical protein [Planctomycetota bacterium]